MLHVGNCFKRFNDIQQRSCTRRIMEIERLAHGHDRAKPSQAIRSNLTIVGAWVIALIVRLRQLGAFVRFTGSQIHQTIELLSSDHLTWLWRLKTKAAGLLKVIFWLFLLSHVRNLVSRCRRSTKADTTRREEKRPKELEFGFNCYAFRSLQRLKILSHRSASSVLQI